MSVIKITLNNAESQVENVSNELLKLLREELMYSDTNAQYQYVSQSKNVGRLKSLIKRDPKNVSYPKQLRKAQFLLKKADAERKVYLMSEEGVFPTGLFPRLTGILDDEGFEWEVIDNRVCPKSTFRVRQIKDFPKLRHYQEAAVEACLFHERGVVAVCTGGGKTLTICKIIRELGKQTVVIVPSLGILHNMHDNLLEYFHESQVTKLDKNVTKLNKINVVNIDTLRNMDPELFKDCAVSIMDEFHHCLVGSTKVYTDKGMLTIKDIVEKDIDCNVMSHFEGKYEWQPVVNRFKYAAPEELIEITYDFKGKERTIRCTPNHKIYTTNRGYVEAQYLTESDDMIIDPGFLCPVCNNVHPTQNSLGGCKTNSLLTEEEKSRRVEKMLASPNWNSVEARKANSESKKGDKNPAKRKEVREKKSKSQKKWWANMSLGEREWRIKTFQSAPLQGVRRGPSSLEQRIVNLKTDFEFTGDGSLWVTAGGKHMNPDFIFNGKVLEVGDEYWHPEQERFERVAAYATIGLNCLYLTNVDMAEMDDQKLKTVIEEFING